MIIDAKNLIIGRLATVVAKQALLGETVNIINSEHAIVTGKKERVFADYKQKRDRGTFKGPYVIRRADIMLKRTIRGMLPYKKERGASAYKRIRCYIGAPEKFKDQSPQTIKEANISKMKNLNYVTLQQICRYLGGKE